MSEIQNIYENINSKIRKVRRRELSIELMSGFFISLSVLILLLVLGGMVENTANGDKIFRAVVAGLIFIGILISAGIYLGPNLAKYFGLIKSQSDDEIALRVGAEYPELKDKLCNAMQVYQNSGQPGGTSGELALDAFGRIGTLAVKKDFSVIIKKDELKRNLLVFIIAFVIFGLITAIYQDTFGQSLYRIINFNKSFLPPAPFSLTISPKQESLHRGEPLTIKVTARGQAPESISLFIKEEQQENYDSFTLKLDSGKTYIYNIPSAKKSLSFYARAMWLNQSVTTEIGKVKVTDKPIIRSISGVLTNPSYTSIAPKTFYEDNADLSSLRGSKVDLSIMANKELSRAQIVIEHERRGLSDISDSTDTTKVVSRISMKLDGKRAIGSFRVNYTGSYYISITDKDGEDNTDPIKYSIIALNDEFPSISLIDPLTDTQVSENALLSVLTSISDDYGFSRLYLNYRLLESKYSEPEEKFSRIEIPILSNSTNAEVPYMWDLTKIGISPEDKYEFYLEVFDNDIVSGPKSAKTGTLTVRLPSLDEVLNVADKAQKQIEKELEKAIKESQEIRKDMEELNKELLKDFNKKEVEWKDKKKLEDLAKKQEELSEKISNVKDDLNKLADDLNQNKAISQETLQKFMELQKLMNEVDSPELRQMQQKMEDAMKQISPEQMQKMLKEAQFDEEKFRKSIERTLKILKRLQAEQKIDALTKRADELEKKQDELSKELENTNPSDAEKKDQLSKEQKDMKNDLDKIEKDMKSLEDLMKEIGQDMPMDQLEQAKNDLNEKETENEMQEAGEQIKKSDFKKAQQSQKKVSSNLNKFSKQMKDMKEQMSDLGRKEAMKQMQKSINDMLKLSKEQEKLKQNTQSADYNSTQIPDLAEKQTELFESLANVANAMVQLGEKSFAVTPEMGKSIGDALQDMQNATEQLASRRPNMAGKEQGGAMSSMNQAISQMQQMLSSLSNQGSGSCNNPGGSGQEGQSPSPGGMGFGQRLQQLAAQQQAINQAMQQASQSPGGEMSSDQQSEFGKIAKEQGKAKKSLEELADEQKKFKTDDKKTLGDLNRISQEMQEVIKDMQSGDINQETLDRQERILSRLLDATRSVHDRDYEKKRESRSGKDYTRQGPDALDKGKAEGKSGALQDLLKSIQQGYTRDYETFIRKYLENLQSQQGEL
jgi:hypothetical protein